MNTFIVYFNDGNRVSVEARTEDFARLIAEKRAIDGFTSIAYVEEL